MRPPDNPQHLLFGGTFVLANKLQFVGDKLVEGLSTKQWFLLRNLAELPQNPPPTISEIAQTMDSSRQNTAKMLEPLEREGLVTVEKNQEDNRRRSVKITAEGMAVLSQMSENSQDFFDRLYGDIPLDKLGIAGEVLKKMMDNLQKMQEGLDDEEWKK